MANCALVTARQISTHTKGRKNLKQEINVFNTKASTAHLEIKFNSLEIMFGKRLMLFYCTTIFLFF